MINRLSEVQIYFCLVFLLVNVTSSTFFGLKTNSANKGICFKFVVAATSNFLRIVVKMIFSSIRANLKHDRWSLQPIQLFIGQLTSARYSSSVRQKRGQTSSFGARPQTSLVWMCEGRGSSPGPCECGSWAGWRSFREGFSVRQHLDPPPPVDGGRWWVYWGTVLTPLWCSSQDISTWIIQ